MQQHYPILLACVLGALCGGCIDSAYDLDKIDKKITLGQNGIVLPLGEMEEETVGSLLDTEHTEGLVTDAEGYLAYERADRIDETIDAIVIDPIENVVSDIASETIEMTDATLPETLFVEGSTHRTRIDLPALAFAEYDAGVIEHDERLAVDFAGGTFPANTPLPALTAASSEQLAFRMRGIPDEVEAVERILFDTRDAFVELTFAPGSLGSAVAGGTLSFTLTLPDAYAYRLTDDYDGHAAVRGGTLTMTDYPVTAAGTTFRFRLAERRVTEPTVNGTLEITDEITCGLRYEGTSNGNAVSAADLPRYTLRVRPAMHDFGIRTREIRPEAAVTESPMRFEIDGLNGIASVSYLAFTDEDANALCLTCTQPALPLDGTVALTVELPTIFDFAPGTEGLADHVLTTTLDRLAAGILLPLRGIALADDEARIEHNTLRVEKTVRITTAPSFPGASHLLSELAASDAPHLDLRSEERTFRLDLPRCRAKAGFTTHIDIEEPIHASFEVPAEVARIDLAEVADARTGSEALLNIGFDLENTPVKHLYFDDIEITLPDFLVVEHPSLVAGTNTLRIDRAEYRGGYVHVTDVAVLGLRNALVREEQGKKKAELDGTLLVSMTVNTPEDTDIEHIAQPRIVITPKATVAPLRIAQVTGAVDLDLSRYLTATTIDLDDLRESLGDQDVELNLRAPTIGLTVSNPVGLRMVGGIVLTPYDLSGKALDPVRVEHIAVEASEGGAEPRITRLWISDREQAPAGYTLCRVERLAELVRIIPSKIDVEFELAVDDTHAQHFAITGEDYAFDVDYDISLPLRFREGARISYSDTLDVSGTFDDLLQYDLRAEDILLVMDARTTLPIDLNVAIEFLDRTTGRAVEGIRAEVLDTIRGYDAERDGEYGRTEVQIRLLPEEGDLNLLQSVDDIRFALTGEAVGADAGLRNEQYITGHLKLHLQRGITIDLDKIAE
ncbi:hypothetical protein [uncultured Alistipes sp.]|nr:hypothetical protein [uncultured Alistipes sp.]